MGKHCKLCKVEAVKGGERSFHRFPDPQYQRKAWCQTLDIDIKTLKNWAFVCSDHFPPDCFLYRSNGQRFLKDDAVPLPYKGQLKRIGRRKKGYRKIMIEQVVVKTEIKTECEEETKPNAVLVKDVKREKPDCLEQNEIKTECEEETKPNTILVKDIKKEEPDFLEQNEEYSCQDYCPEIPVKIKVIAKKDPDTSHLKSDDAIIKGSEDLNVNMDFQSEGIAENPEFNNWMQGDGVEEQEDIIPRLFKLAYPELRTSNLYSCKECSFQTSFCQNLRKHFIKHRETEFRSDPEKYKEYKAYRCYKCSYITIQRYNLSRHMIKHLPNDGKIIRKYSCNECDYSTKYSCDMVKHRLKHVSRGSKFDCTKCAYKAYDQKHLVEHVKKGHINTKKYKYDCIKCPYKTDSKNALNRHVRESHSENKPFKYECTSCSFKSDSKTSFNKHLKEAHSKVGPPPLPE